MMAAALTQDINQLTANSLPEERADGGDVARLAEMCRIALVGGSGERESMAMDDQTAARIAALAVRVRLTGPSARAFAAGGRTVPPALARTLDGARARAMVSNGRVMALARIAFPLLDRAGIPAMAFKGPFQHRLLHGDPFFCRAADLDLLVAREHFDAALAALAAQGFVRREGTSAWWTTALGEVHLVHPEGGVIDLHHRLQQPGCPPPRDLAGFLAGAQREALGGTSIAVPTHAQAVLVSALNFTKEFAHRRPSARYAYDVAAGLIGMGEARRRAFAALAMRQRLTGTVALAAALCERVFGIALPLASPLAAAALPDWAAREALLAMVFDPENPATPWPRRRAVLWAMCSGAAGRHKAAEFTREAARMIGSEALRRAAPEGV
ncbi:MAG: nucleotidyltransferase family protein [Erythrobacter sp.]|uniref:nucleotidyltransferase family protein n=1 Tax=Erythrobacter sp. TaxID=1042 RepID=UPI0025DE98F2|nr:nucleotidyltransferase family protein [Erythrobacter sp.]MCM0001372.1 nucleotidyltransferase family protein [Erythrobacter sp.]